MTINKLSEYGHPFQIKVICSLLTDKKFLQNISDILSADYFDSEAHKWIINYILEYFSQWRTIPTMEVLAIETKKIKNEVNQMAVREELKEAYMASTDDVQYIQEEFSSFCKNQAVKNAAMQIPDLLNSGLYDDIRKVMSEALKAGQVKDAGHDYNKDIEERFRDDDAKTIDFPWKIFNTITDGGISPGNLVLLFAPPGIGKTTVVCNIASHNAKSGKKIMYFTLELPEKYIGKKIDSILSGIDVKELKYHRKQIEELISSVGGIIKIKSYPPKRASLDTIEAHLDYLEISEGFIPDLIILDYPELLKVKKIRRESREETDDIYMDIKGIAMERYIPWVCPSQINRAGSDDEIIEGNKVAGSYGKMMIGDLNISLSRRRKDKKHGTGRFHIIKSRLGPDGMTYSAKIDLASGYIDISEEEYDEDEVDSERREANGNIFNVDEINRLRNRFSNDS